MSEVLKNEEIFWAQKARTNWLQLDDKTKYFQTVANIRRKMNEINKIKNNQGIWWWKGDGLEKVFVHDFKNKFSASNMPSPAVLDNFVDLIEPCISAEQSGYLNSPILESEVFDAVKSMPLGV